MTDVLNGSTPTITKLKDVLIVRFTLEMPASSFSNEVVASYTGTPFLKNGRISGTVVDIWLRDGITIESIIGE